MLVFFAKSSFKKNNFAGGSKRDKWLEIDSYCLQKFYAARHCHQTVHDMDIRKWGRQKSIEVSFFISKNNIKNSDYAVVMNHPVFAELHYSFNLSSRPRNHG